MGVIIDIIAKLASIGVNITASQREYLKWRMSEEGKKYFKRKEDNRFYNALAKGDTSVIDTAVHEKQETINRLKRELGLLTVLILMLIPGCALIPNRNDDLTPNALKTEEHTYTIQDLRLKADQGYETLTGQWHIVSSDFMKDYVRNQDTLIESLQLLKETNDKVYFWRCVFVATAVVYLTLFVLLMIRFHRVFTKN